MKKNTQAVILNSFYTQVHTVWTRKPNLELYDSKTSKVNEVGEAIHEVYDSKGDILFGGEKIKIKPVRNLGGHNIEQYEIHAKKGFYFCRFDLSF